MKIIYIFIYGMHAIFHSVFFRRERKPADRYPLKFVF